jgi:hypothetical protein
MNTTKPSTRVKTSFCRCGSQFTVETRGQKSCPTCIEAKALAEANKPPVICRYCGEEKHDCRFRICPDCKAAKEAKEEAAKAARPLKACKTCGELSRDLNRARVCYPCNRASWASRLEEDKERRRREKWERIDAQRQEKEEEQEEAAPATGDGRDDEYLNWFSELPNETQIILLDSMKQLCWEAGSAVPGIEGRNPFPMSWDEAFERHQRRLEACTGALSSVGDLGTHKPAPAPTDDIVNLEQVAHVDQVDIDAIFRNLLSGIDF